MTDRNAKTEDVRALVEEYLQANELIDYNERRIDGLIETVNGLDAETSALVERQRQITAHLAPLFGDESQLVKACRRGRAFVVTHASGDPFLTVRPLRDVSSLVKAEAPRPRVFSDAEIDEAAIRAAVRDFVKLPGRRVRIRDGRIVDHVGHDVTVIDQEAG